MSTQLPAPIADAWVLIALVRAFNDRFPIRRNALPRDPSQLEDIWPNDWTHQLEQSSGIQLIPIDWDLIESMMNDNPHKKPHKSKVNLCECSKCGGRFGIAFAKHDTQGNIVCRRCAETPTIPNDSDDTPSGAD
jgi:hypothetical protein